MFVSNDSVVLYKVGPAWYSIAFYMNGIDDSDGPENGPEAVNIPLPQPAKRRPVIMTVANLRTLATANSSGRLWVSDGS